MTIATFKIKCEATPRSVNIRNWRLMMECLYFFGNADSTLGTRMMVHDGLIDIMGYTPPMIHKAILEDEVIETVFSTNYSMDPGFCDRCNGMGKLDWINSVTSPKHNLLYSEKYARFFVREESRVLFYEDQSCVGGYNFAHIFAPAKIQDDRVETRCKHCSGTGIHLDGRRVLFTGMVGLRGRLKEFEWDERNIPRG